MDKNKQLDALFRSAREQQVKSSFDETKDQFMDLLSTSVTSAGRAPTEEDHNAGRVPTEEEHNAGRVPTEEEHNAGRVPTEEVYRDQQQKMKLSLTQKWLIMIATVSILVGVVLLFNTSPTRPIENQNESNVSKQETNESKVFASSNEDFESTESSKESRFFAIDLEQTFVIEHLDINRVAEDTASLYTNVDRQKLDPIQKDEYIFPKLTDEEISANHKQKKQMLKALEKFDRKVYSFLVSGNVDVNGKISSIQAFIMQKTEVTNLEYRTFLFDLLIQGRNDGKAVSYCCIWY